MINKLRDTMKKWLIILPVFLFGVLLLQSCNAKVENNFTFKNNALTAMYVNFRGNIITVPAGKTIEVKEIPQGTYDYVSTFDIPAGATSSSSSGDMTGQVLINASTKITILYTSTYSGSVYTVTANKTSSDNQNPDNPLTL